VSEIENAVRGLKPRPAFDHPLLLLASERQDVRLAAWRAALPTLKFANEDSAARLLSETLSIFGNRSKGTAELEEFKLLVSLRRPGAVQLARLLELGLYDWPRRCAIEQLGLVLGRLTDEELEKTVHLPLVRRSEQLEHFEAALAVRRKAKVPLADWDQRAKGALERARSAAAALDGAAFSGRARLEALRGLTASVEEALASGDTGVVEIAVLRLEHALDEI
jgi:hypothetical protein